MKKILITSILAISTSLAVYFVAFWQPKEEINNNLVLENPKKTEDSNTKKDNNEDTNKESSIDINKNKNSNYNNEEKNEKDKINDNSSKNKEDKENLNTPNNEESKENKNSNNSSNNKKEETQATNAKIFNVNKEEILGNLSLVEKTKLFTIANKISTVDVERMKNSLKKNGEKEGITEVVRVLKLRLKSDDYDEIKNILSPYINIEFLESLV